MRLSKKGLFGTLPFRKHTAVEFLLHLLSATSHSDHGWIDWSWPASDIEKFILAFDDPHPGARTFWRNEIVVLRNCQLHVGEIGHHPFQTGLIIRNNRKWLTVALGGEHCLLVSDARDENGRDLIPHIKEGDRFFTPQSKLDLAKMTRVRFTPTGSRSRSRCLPTDRRSL